MSDDAFQYVLDAARQLVASLSADSESMDGPRSPISQQQVNAALDRCLQQLTAVGPRGPENRLASSKLWEIAGGLLSRGALQLRARSKPLGYAGDYIMLTQIYEQTRCDDPLGELFDDYFQALDAPEAVRQRIDLAAAELQTHCSFSPRDDYRLAVIGSGPAIELEMACRAGTPPKRVLLLDLDQSALDEAQRRLAAIDGPLPILTARRENLYRLPGRADRVLPGESCDMLICLGLFDYLAVEDAVAHLQTYWHSLRPGGRMLVGNFSFACQSRAYMEWIGNWYLLFRTPDDLWRLADQAGIPPDCAEVTATVNGVNLLLRATKPNVN